MKKTSPLLLGILIFAALALKCGPRAPSEIDISGQVFIVTQGGANFKLGLVEVKVFDEQSFLSSIRQKRESASAFMANYTERRDALIKEIEPYQNRFNEANKRWEANVGSYRLLDQVNKADEELKAKKADLNGLKEETKKRISGQFWVEDLPVPLQIVKTDADGNFVLRLKPGKYGLVADSRRKVADKTEEYFWLVWIDVKEGFQKRIFLSNDNLLETFCADCIVRPADIPQF